MDIQVVRELPRPFSLHWGKGQIVEEASYYGEHHQPCIQLLEFEDGGLQTRFCYYSLSGRFQRGALMLGQDEMAGLSTALDKTPRLKVLLRQMVE